MANFLPNGLGDYPTGDSLARAEPLQISGNVWYVDSATGVDAVSPRGLSEGKPLATLAQAITNAADDDIIVLADQHFESVTAAITVSKRLSIVGAGSSAGIPTARINREGGASVNLLTITGQAVQLRNILIGESGTSAVATARLSIAAARFRMVGCYVQCGSYDTGPAISYGVGGTHSELRNCTFVATTADPESAIKNAFALTDLRIFNCTFDGGASGFTNTYAIDLTTSAINRLECEGLSLLNGADMGVHADTTGWVHVELATGGSRVSW